MSVSALLRLDRVTKRYRDGAREIAVLDEVSLDLRSGEASGIVGERRSGKTTLLRVAAGVELPDSGCVCFAGSRVEPSIDERARLWRQGGIALVSGDWRPPAGRRALEQVAMPLLADGVSAQEADRSAQLALERVNIGSLSDAIIDTLSIAERIRVNLARALVREPRVLLIDEPAVLPGPSDARELYALLRGLPRALGLGMLIASEDVSALTGLPRVLSLGDGRLISSGAGEADVIRFPASRAREGSEGR
jgi:predicted ABC-type transport system involved in lysophospholipase L1 biosynthesis ATPase subunit